MEAHKTPFVGRMRIAAAKLETDRGSIVTRTPAGRKDEVKAKPKQEAEEASGENTEKAASKMGSSYDSDMKILLQFVPGLAQAAAAFMREAERLGQKAQ